MDMILANSCAFYFFFPPACMEWWNEVKCPPAQLKADSWEEEEAVEVITALATKLVLSHSQVRPCFRAGENNALPLNYISSLCTHRPSSHAVLRAQP